MKRKSSNILLAIDTSTKMAGLALYDGIQVLCETIWKSQYHHTVELAPAIVNALSRSNVAISNLGAISVALGPGSFTGLRIGLAFAKGLSLTNHIPLIGIPSLDALAAAQPVQKHALFAVLQAGRGRIAVRRYTAQNHVWQSIDDHKILTLDELVKSMDNNSIICGELTEEDREELLMHSNKIELTSPAQSLRRPSYIAELAWNQWQSGESHDPAALSPIYLHHNDPIPG